MVHHSLVGTWKLVSWEFRSANGEVSYPMGRSALGFLMYTPDGFMSATIMSPERPPFVSPDMRKGTMPEKVAAFETYISYCGTYEHRDGAVVHHVRASLFPNWIGRDQERIIEWVEDRLRLSTPPVVFDGIQRTAHLLWERLQSD